MANFSLTQRQKHYSGFFWAVTEHDLAIYESRLELARLLLADFDASVRHIMAQPFLLRAEVDGELRRHVPDYLLFTETDVVVVGFSSLIEASQVRVCGRRLPPDPLVHHEADTEAPKEAKSYRIGVAAGPGELKSSLHEPEPFVDWQPTPAW